MLRFLLVTLLAGLSFPLSTTSASATGACCCFCRAGRCSVKVDKQEVQDSVFDVECETICIPPIRFPWECGPLRKCGQVRVIKKLVTDKEKRVECTYEWSATTCCPQCRHRIMCPPVCAVPAARAECVGPPAHPEPAKLVEQAGGATASPADQNAALKSAIAHSKPDEDGWVVIKNTPAAELSADTGLIDTEVEIVDSQTRRK